MNETTKNAIDRINAAETEIALLRLIAGLLLAIANDIDLIKSDIKLIKQDVRQIE